MSDLRMQMLTGAGAALIRAQAVTWRYHWMHSELLVEARNHHPAVILSIWHGRLLPLLWSHRNRRIQMVASQHRDGEMLGQTIRRFGYGHVRGSSTRGGAGALRGLVRCINDGLDVGLTVDGPVGPRFVAKPGAIQVARMTGAAVVPVTSASAHRRVLSSWDAFELPLPFTRVAVSYGAPVIVPRDADAAVIEEKRQELERRLCEITEDADAFVRGR